MKRNVLVVLLVLPLVAFAVRNSPASGLPTGQGIVTNLGCGIGGGTSPAASCWKYCCTPAGKYVHTISGYGNSTTCTTAYTKCTSCLSACNAGEVVCNSGGGCL